MPRLSRIAFVALLATTAATAFAEDVVYASMGPQIVRVNLATGDRTTVSSSSVGSGPGGTFRQMRALDADTLLVVSLRTPSGIDILTVDVTTGDRTVVTASGSANGAEFANAGGLDVEGGFAYFTNTGSGTLLSLNLSTGVTTVVSGGVVGSGPAISAPRDVEVVDGTAYVTNASFTELFAIDLATGARSAISTSSVGTGPHTSKGYMLAETGGTLLVSDNDDGLLRIDPATGNRSYVSATGSTEVGSGDTWESPAGFDYLSSASLVVGASGFAIQGFFTVDLSTGTRTLVSGNSLGSGPMFTNNIIPYVAVVSDAVSSAAPSWHLHE